ncbi:MAG: ClpXP protease specificity-enhancing factor [Azoarcus sp.]|jgi:stringent starvation protein B|nr:ClpXP protease specificity-enhancing factor [Azoarcus sp.]
MISTKPYLIRAIHEWCVDQGFTPYLAVLVDEHARVPPGYARDGQIVLNVAPEATHQLVMNNEHVTFQARFNGVAHHIVAPIDNITAIYARENGQGMAFEPRAPDGAPAKEGDRPPPDDRPPPRGSHLKIIK